MFYPISSIYRYILWTWQLLLHTVGVEWNVKGVTIVNILRWGFHECKTSVLFKCERSVSVIFVISYCNLNKSDTASFYCQLGTIEVWAALWFCSLMSIFQMYLSSWGLSCLCGTLLFVNILLEERGSLQSNLNCFEGGGKSGPC